MQLIRGLLSFVVPLVIVLVASRLVHAPQIPDAAKSDPGLVKDAISSLIATSQWLGTVTVSAMAAGGLIIYKERKNHLFLCQAFGCIGFSAGVASVFFSCALTYWSSISLPNGTIDVQSLADMFATQALCALVLACATAALFVGGSAHDA